MKIYYNGKYKIIDSSENEFIYRYLDEIPDYQNKITEVEITPDTRQINNRAFLKCKSLEKVTIPESVTTIGICAFENCESLTKIMLPDSIIKIEDYAFYNCIKLDDIIFENNPDLEIDYTAFGHCNSLELKTIEKIMCQIAKNVNFYEISNFIELYNIKYNSEFMQELMTINIGIFTEASEIDQEVFIEAALDSINNIYTKDNKQIIKTDLCNIIIKNNKLYLSLADNNFKQVSPIFINKIKNAIEISKEKGDIDNESVL